MKFTTTAAALLAAASASPALAQVFTITGTRIPRDAVAVATLVKDGITIITGTRLPTANANIAAVDVPISFTSVPTPTTFETRVAATPLQARAVSGAPNVSPSGAPVASPGVVVAARAPEPVDVSGAPSVAPSGAPVASVAPTVSVAPIVSVAPVAARAADNVFIEKRCLALGSECGNNGVYTDCCDDQLCAENHGTGSLTCGGVSV
ncbi:uncharacterized protein J3D65DRAFT_675799 [Phyllosticta citribraziliensis]|uniref:Uncharacterized protein n=1 Tax=Phyllosticta citribraziliensis TaxID=989973 RepID=A0ABR1LYH9_9PEZI